MVRRHPPQRFSPRRPNVVDELLAGERQLDALVPQVRLTAIPAANTVGGREWRNQVGQSLRRQLVGLCNANRWPGAIVGRARGLLRRFESNVVLQGYRRWWLDETPKRGERS